MPYDAVALHEALLKLEVDASQSYFAIALSGGADSLALLVAMADLVSKDRILALHFDHRIHPESSSWRALCQAICDDLDIAFRFGEWDDNSRPDQPGEADARTARYHWFSRILPETHILLTGHHCDDQAETVLMGLAEGRNLDRVAGIPRIRHLSYGDKRKVIRPLLDFHHADLCQFLRIREISWIEDPANKSAQHARTLIRQTVIPALAERWPNVTDAISRVAADLTEALEVIDEVSDGVINNGIKPEKRTLLCLTNPLDISALSSLSLPGFKAVVRRWVHRGGASSPSDNQLEELKRQLGQIDSESHCQIDCGNTEIRYFDRNLYLIEKVELQYEIDMACGSQFQALRPWLSVSFEPAASGIPESLLTAGKLRWQNRRGSHRFTASTNSGSNSLKKMMQARKLAPWVRQAFPVLTMNQDVVWAQGLGVNAQYRQSEPGKSAVIPSFAVSLQN